MGANVRDAAERQQLTVRLLEQNGGASVRELSELCGVSEMTVRRDLDALEREGVIKRHHGGAVVTRRSVIEMPYTERSTKNQDKKRRIAAYAHREIVAGQSIALGNGSTPYELALLIREMSELNVLTPSLHTALVLAQSGKVSTAVPGLMVRGTEASMVGAEAVEGVNQFYFDLAFVGAAGVDAAIGITEYNADEVAVTRAILRRAARRVVLADSSKLGRVANVVASGLKEIDLLVTSDDADPDVVAELRAHDLKVELV